MLKECAYTCHALLSITECTASLEVVGIHNTTISGAICASTWSLVYLLSDKRNKRTVHLSLWVLETITSWTKAADVQNNLGFAHWTWKASPISRWNWSSVESAAPSCPLWILKTCICIWIAYSCVFMYITHKYKELATLRVWTNYKIVKYQINVHDIKYIPTW